MKPNHPFQFCSVKTVENHTVICLCSFGNKTCREETLAQSKLILHCLYVTISFVLLATVVDENRRSDKTTTETLVRPVLFLFCHTVRNGLITVKLICDADTPVCNLGPSCKYKYLYFSEVLGPRSLSMTVLRVMKKS